MNISALQQMTEHWDEIAGGLQYLRDLYRRPSVCVRYIDLWRIGELGAQLPAYLLYRRVGPIGNGRLPAHIAGIFKMMVGLNSAVLRLAQLSIITDPAKAQAPIDLDELFEFIETSDLLIGPKQVCAGPASLIKKAIEILVAPSSGHDDAAAVDEQNQMHLGGRPAPFLAFAYGVMNATVLKGLYAMITESLYAVARRSLLPGTGEANQASFREVDDRLPLFDEIDPSIVKLIIGGIVEHGVEFGGADGAQLRQQTAKLGEVFDSEALVSTRDVAAHALRGHAMASAQVIDTISQYLHLERVGAAIADILRRRCLTSLGAEDASEASMIGPGFYPSNMKMRHLLSLVFELDFAANTVVHAGKDVLALSQAA